MEPPHFKTIKPYGFLLRCPFRLGLYLLLASICCFTISADDQNHSKSNSKKNISRIQLQNSDNWKISELATHQLQSLVASLQSKNEQLRSSHSGDEYQQLLKSSQIEVKFDYGEAKYTLVDAEIVVSAVLYNAHPDTLGVIIVDSSKISLESAHLCLYVSRILVEASVTPDRSQLGRSVLVLDGKFQNDSFELNSIVEAADNQHRQLFFPKGRNFWAWAKATLHPPTAGQLITNQPLQLVQGGTAMAIGALSGKAWHIPFWLNMIWGNTIGLNINTYHAITTRGSFKRRFLVNMIVSISFAVALEVWTAGALTPLIAISTWMHILSNLDAHTLQCCSQQYNENDSR